MTGNRTTIYRKLLVPGLLLFLAVSVLFYIFTAYGGYKETAQEARKRDFRINTQTRAQLLEIELLSRWADVAQLTKELNEAAAAYIDEKSIGYEQLGSEGQYANEFLGRTAGSLLETIERNQIGGAFVVLCPDVEAAHPYKERNYMGMYFRKQTDGEDSELALEQGDESIARALSMERSVRWICEFTYNPSQGEDTYFLHPIMEAYSYRSLEMSDLGCFSAPILPKATDTERVIIYTVPLIAQDKTIYGSAGVEIPLDAVLGYLDNAKSGIDYTLVRYEADRNSEESIRCSCLVPAENGGKEQRLKLLEKETGTYSADQEDADTKRAAQIAAMDLYSVFSPFANERWAVLGVMEEEKLLGGYEGKQASVLLGILCLFVMVTVFLWYVARQFLRPIHHFRNQLEEDAEQWEVQKGTCCELEQLQNIVMQKQASFRKEQGRYREEIQRCLMALRQTAGTIFEYDCREDALYRYTIQQRKSGILDTKCTAVKHFLRDMDTGQYCRTEDVIGLTKLLKGHAEETIEIKLISENSKKLVWSVVRGTPVLDEDGNAVKVIGIIQDIHNRKKREEEQNSAEQLDRTTGLMSRECGESRIREFLRSKKKEQSVSLCIIDLDDFSRINEYYGLIYGDILLEDIGGILKRYLYDGSIGVRLGGDEFLLFMKNSKKEETMRICMSICANIKDMYVGYGQIQSLTCSIGFVHRTGFVDYNNLIRYAGSAMCEVKQQGKDGVEEYFGLYEKKGKALGKIVFGTDRVINEIESAQGSGTVVTVAFNIFEKCVDFRSALCVLFKKIGCDFGLSRIWMLLLDERNRTGYIAEQWSMFGLDAVGDGPVLCTEEEIRELKAKFQDTGILVVDRHARPESLQKISGPLYISGDHDSLYCAMYNDGEYMGCLMFRKGGDHAPWNQQQISILKTAANLTAIHYAKYLRQREKEQHDVRERELCDALQTALHEYQGMQLDGTMRKTLEELIALHQT